MSTLQCLQDRENGRESDSYEWLCMTNEYEKKQMALYYYKSDRCHSNVEEILGKEYHGIIHSGISFYLIDHLKHLTKHRN